MNNRACKSVMQTGAMAEIEMSKFARIELIRKFQRVEGNFDCCASAYTRVCKQLECLWRDECLAMTQD